MAKGSALTVSAVIGFCRKNGHKDREDTKADRKLLCVYELFMSVGAEDATGLALVVVELSPTSAVPCSLPILDWRRVSLDFEMSR